MGLYKTASLLNRVKNFLNPENIGEIKSALKNVKETNSVLARENSKLRNENKSRFRKGLTTGLGFGVLGGTAATTGGGLYLYNESLKKKPVAVVNEVTKSTDGNYIKRRRINVNPDVLSLVNRQNQL